MSEQPQQPSGHYDLGKFIDYVWALREERDTLAQRLQEAERLLSCAKQYELGPTLNSMIDAFLSKKETK